MMNNVTLVPSELVTKIKEYIDDYCYSHMVDQPKTFKEYVEYANRFYRVALINEKEYNAFVMYVKKNKDIT